MHTYDCTYIPMDTHACACMYTHVGTGICLYMHAHVCTLKHTDVHAGTWVTYLWSCLLSRERTVQPGGWQLPSSMMTCRGTIQRVMPGVRDPLEICIFRWIGYYDTQSPLLMIFLTFHGPLRNMLFCDKSATMTHKARSCPILWFFMAPFEEGQFGHRFQFLQLFKTF